MQFCVWWNEERAIQIYLRQTEVKVLTSACSLNHLQWLQHVTAPLNCPAWQNRTPNVRQNWVKQSSLPQWTKHTSRPGTRNLTVVSFRNSHGPGASAAPLTYNHSCHRISNAIPFRVFLTFLSVKQNLDFFPLLFTETCSVEEVSERCLQSTTASIIEEFTAFVTLAFATYIWKPSAEGSPAFPY